VACLQAKLLGEFLQHGGGLFASAQGRETAVAKVGRLALNDGGSAGQGDAIVTEINTCLSVDSGPFF
jgi:hypothetical protein